jgi:hypothetical protein
MDRLGDMSEDGKEPLHGALHEADKLQLDKTTNVLSEEP